MSTVADRSTNYPQPQQISGLLNYSPTGPSYPDPLQLQTAPTHTSHPVPLQNDHPNDIRSPATPTDAKVRLRKACDSCSVRKVKCDESGPPCRSCAALDIPCTFERPSRRRGPPNRHAEAIKRQRLGPSVGSTDSGSVDLQPHSSILSAESICPLPTLQLLIDDYFTYIHPLIPLPHEPTFRTQLHRRDDLTDRTFLALVANMIGVLVASFPRRPRQLLSSEEDKRRFPNATAVLRVCERVAAEARGPAYLLGRLTVYDALNSYLSGVIQSYQYDFRRGRLCFGECLLIVRDLRMHRAPDHQSPETQTSYPDGPDDDDDTQEVDLIKQELGRRLFWVLYAGVQTMRQLGSRDVELLIPPLSMSDPPPPLPIEVDDAWISKTHISEPPPGLVSELVGFNANVGIMRAWNSLVAFELSSRFSEAYDHDRQKQVIAQCLQNAKRATDTIPQELYLSPSSPNGWPSLEDPYFHSRRQDPWREETSNEPREARAPYSRRRVQFEIQKANIYATQLATRSYLVEKYWALCEVHEQRQFEQETNSQQDPALTANENYGQDSAPRPGSRGLDAEQQAMAYEREDIVKDLAVLLSSINQVNMEPNGISFTSKIRTVASTLLHRPKPAQMAMSSLDYESMQQYLSRFIDILMKLERLGPGLVDPDSPTTTDGSLGNWGNGATSLSPEELEERELVQWASLKDHQEKFTRESGFLRD